ncbi:MAG: site-2 protease family protein [Candidatus Kapabacteria bacterium]|nr:site-2 protease family protein [Candidatus Kapabacteria bacterium]
MNLNHLIPIKNPYLKNIVIPLLLLIITFITSTIAGTMWACRDYSDLLNWHYGLTYSILIIFVLGSHEMGHYIAARIHKIDCTLPHFIPMFVPGAPQFGTMGAVIKTRAPFTNRKVLFDIGVAGPIAGFVATMIVLVYGFATLPSPESIFIYHPEYHFINKIPETGLHFGSNILFEIFGFFAIKSGGWVPPMNEIYHYPFLCVGWFGLFVTMLNMLPIGQLDGGHVIYAMFGRWQSIISRIFWWMCIIIAVGAVLNFLIEFLNSDINFPFKIFFEDYVLFYLKIFKNAAPWYFSGWGGWLVWAIICKVFIKLDHVPVADSQSIGTRRMIIGIIAIIIFIISFNYCGVYEI